MTAAPLIRRELYTAARRGRNQRVRWWISALGLVGLALFLFTLTTGAILPVSGRVIFQSIGVWIYYYCLVAGAVITADAISSERREGTLGLLFLTDLTGWDVVGGKLTSALLPILYAVMGLVPMLSVLMLAGGVTLSDLGRIALIGLTAVVFSGSVGLFCSSLSLNERKSAFAALVISLSVTELLHAAATMLGLHVRSGTLDDPVHWCFEMALPWADQLDQWTLPYLRDEATKPAIQRGLFNFGTRILGHWLAAGVLLGFASHFARKGAGGIARNRFGEWIWQWSNRWTYGSGAMRAGRRRRLLTLDAVMWLCLRHARKRAYGWIFVFAMAMVAIAVESRMSGFVWPWVFLAIFLGTVHAVFKAWIASETCYQMVEDRRSGALELILSTPVDALQIARGHFRSHRHQLMLPIVALLVGELGWLSRMSRNGQLLEGEQVMAVFVTCLVTLVLDIWAVRWLALWYGLIKPTANAAVQACMRRIFVLPILLFLPMVAVPGAGPLAALGFQDYRVVRIAFLWIALVAVIDIPMGLWARARFFKYMRRVVSEGVGALISGAPGGTGRQSSNSSTSLKSSEATPVLRPALTSESLDPRADANDGASIAPMEGRAAQRTTAVVPWPQFRQRDYVLAAAAVLILGFIVSAKWKQQSRRIAFEQHVEAIRARGEPLPNQLPEQWKSTAAPDDNVVAGLASLIRASALSRAETKPSGIKLTRPFRTHPLQKDEFAKIEAWLADSAIDLDTLRQVLRRQRVQYDYTLAAAPDHGLPESYRLERFVLLLKGVAVLASATGRQDDAADAILDMLRMAEVLADHPGSSGQFFRMKILPTALESLEGVLSAGPIETARLSRLRAGLVAGANDRFLEQYLTWEQFQRADIATTAAGYRKSLDRIVRGGPTWVSPMMELYRRYERFIGIDYIEALRNLRQQETLLTIWRQPLIERARSLTGLENAGQGSRRRSQFMGIPTVRPDMSSALMQMELECVAMIHATCTALSIEEYRARTDRLPEGLLAPDLARASDLTINPYNGKPLHLNFHAPGYSITGEWSSRAPRTAFKFLKKGQGYEFSFSVDR